MKLKNKITLITGASAGIGEATARTFAAEGSNLILTARRYERIKNLADELTKTYNLKVLPLELDVRSYDAVQKAFSSLPDEFKDIDILINNAGKALGIEKFEKGLIEN